MSESPEKSTAEVAVTPSNGHTELQPQSGELTPEVSPTPKMSRRDEVAMQRAAKKKEEEDNLRFKPSLVHRKSATPSKKNGDPESPAKPEEPAHSRLYSDARKKQEDLKNASPKPEFPFKPTIAARSGSATRARAKSPLDTSNRLHAHGTRKPRSEEPVSSFKPTISKRAKSLERNPGMSTTDRLYAQAIIAKEKQEKMREQAQRQQEASNTFAPTTNANSKARANDKPRTAPVSERMQSYIEQRNKKLEDARKEKEAREAAEFTGRPSIGKRKDSKTTTTAANTNTNVNVFDRLTRAVVAPEAQKEKEETFKPVLFTARRSQSASKASRRSTGMTETSEPIHDRLYHEAEQRRRELAAERDLARQEEEKQLTFAPQISSRPSDGTHEMPQTDMHGAPMSVFKRLNSMTKDEVLQRNEKLKQEKELEECTFHPEINPKSAGLFKAAEPVHVRLMKEAERQKELKRHFEERKAEEELQECTFTPDLSHSMSFNNGMGRKSGEFGPGNSFNFSEADETEKRSPVSAEGVVACAPVVKPPPAAVAALSPAPAGLKPLPVGAPVNLAALNLSPAPSGLKSLPAQTSSPVVSTPSLEIN